MEKMKNSKENTNLILDSTDFKMFINEYDSFEKRYLDGDLGATPKFWMLYQDVGFDSVNFSVNVNY